MPSWAPHSQTPTYQAKQLFALEIEMKVQQQQKDSAQVRTAPRCLSGAQDLWEPALRTEGHSLPPGTALKRSALEEPAEMDFCRPQESSRRSSETYTAMYSRPLWKLGGFSFKGGVSKAVGVQPAHQ